MNEQSLLSKVLPFLEQGSDIFVGPGDDCAAIDVGTDKLLLIAADQVVANIHYDKSNTSPARAGKKLLKRNISDIAAMGGTPAHAVLTIASACKDENWFIDFFKGIAEEAKKWGISICGGDLSSTKSEDEVCTLTITGWVEKEKLCLRKNAKAGDAVYCTGVLGNTFHTDHHLDFEPRVEMARFLAGEYTNAMMDISDGVALDLKRMIVESELGAEVDVNKLPLRDGADFKMALTDGEDYELLFSVSPELESELLLNWPFKYVKLSKIGHFTNDKFNLVYFDDVEMMSDKINNGFDHFC